ncbi:MAG: ASKHA domain-containing protein [Bacillota bacterium]
MVTVRFVNQGKEAEVAPGTSLLTAAALAGVPVEGNCGGKGTCGKCKVRILSGRRDGWVLACQYNVEENTEVEFEGLKDAYRRKTALGGVALGENVEPAVEKVFLTLNEPTVEDQTPDYERLTEALACKDIDFNLPVLAGIPRVLREGNFRVTAVLGGKRLLAVEPGDTVARKFGVAFDIGTTTIVGSLVSLNDGEVMAVAALTNPQNVFGADVISRIDHAAKGPEELKQLQAKVLVAVNSIINKLLAETGVAREHVYEAAIVGNTTMSHLFLGIDPTYLAPAPFIPAVRQPVDIAAAVLNIGICPTGRVFVLPNVAGYVGSDTVAVMLATKIQDKTGLCLAIDIGTNGELVMAGRGQILTCSTAAGPAFEGAQIRHGMRAADGAIEAVKITDDVQLKVIGSAPPQGICGSGLIDAVAEMLEAGIITAGGRFINPDKEGADLDDRIKARLRKNGQAYEFVLVPGTESAAGEDIVLTQKDIRELQLAKGAIGVGVKVLLKEIGASTSDITELLIAGAFGSHINIENALKVGLLPQVPAERIVSVGNAAGDGAKLALVSKTQRQLASELASRVRHVELSTRPDFRDEFLKAIQFSNTNNRRS